MVEFELIRSTIVQGLSKYLGIPVIESDSPADMPKPPFMTYNFITTGIVDGFSGLVTTQGLGEDITEHYMDQPTMTVSFNAYALRKADSIQTAMRAADWFRVIGYEEMVDKADVVVVDVGDIHNRDVQVGDEWERRNGFDVDLRATSMIDINQTWIEKANVRSERFGKYE